MVGPVHLGNRVGHLIVIGPSLPVETPLPKVLPDVFGRQRLMDLVQRELSQDVRRVGWVAVYQHAQLGVSQFAKFPLTDGYHTDPL